jgi:hypothetical protein
MADESGVRDVNRRKVYAFVRDWGGADAEDEEDEEDEENEEDEEDIIFSMTRSSSVTIQLSHAPLIQIGNPERPGPVGTKFRGISNSDRCR